MFFLNIKAYQYILLHQIHKIMIFKKASYDPFNRLEFVTKTPPLEKYYTHIFTGF